MDRDAWDDVIIPNPEVIDIQEKIIDKEFRSESAPKPDEYYFRSLNGKLRDIEERLEGRNDEHEDFIRQLYEGEDFK